MHLWQRQSTECQLGTSFYVCQATGFRGCCTVDACQRGGCPDVIPKPSITITVSLEPTASVTSHASIITASTQTPSTSGSSPTTIASSTSAKASVVTASTRFAPVSATSGPADSSSVSVSHEARPTSPSSLPKTAIIAGSVVGALGILLVALLIWLCLRRKRNEKLSGHSSTASFAERKGPYVPEDGQDEEERLHSSDPFAPFGGYQRSPSMLDRRSTNDTLISERSVNHGQVATQPSDDNDDAPLPDIEKSAITAPPLVNHPALQPRPSETPCPPIRQLTPGIVSPSPTANPLPFVNGTKSNQTRRRADSHLPVSHPKVQSTMSNPAEVLCSLAALPSQKRNRNPVTKGAIQRRSYVPLHSTQQGRSEKSARKMVVSLSDPFYSQNSPVPGRSELPAVVPQELPTTPAGRVYYNEEINQASVRYHSKELDLGSKSRRMNDSPEMEREVDTYHPSPRSAQSPALSSPYYQTHLVSPEVPTALFFSSRDSPASFSHISQLQSSSPPRSRKTSADSLNEVVSRSPPHEWTVRKKDYIPQTRNESTTTPQRPQIDTSSQPITHRRSRSPILRSRQAFTGSRQASLGKGRTHATAWSRYEQSRNGSDDTSVRSSFSGSGLINTSSATAHTMDRETENHTLLQREGSDPRPRTAERGGEAESPVTALDYTSSNRSRQSGTIPLILPRLQTDTHSSFHYNHHPEYSYAQNQSSPRWSGSTVAANASCPSSPVSPTCTDTVSPADTISLSPSIYSQDCDTMRSDGGLKWMIDEGDTYEEFARKNDVEGLKKIVAKEKERPSSIMQTPLEMTGRNDWFERH